MRIAISNTQISMATDSKILLAVNTLIHEHGNDAEEHATKNLWAARQAQDQAEAAHWQSFIDALKEVRAFRKKV